MAVLYKPGVRVRILQNGWKWGLDTGTVIGGLRRDNTNYYIVLHDGATPRLFGPLDDMEGFDHDVKEMIYRFDIDNDYWFDAMLRGDGIAWFRESSVQVLEPLDAIVRSLTE